MTQSIGLVTCHFSDVPEFRLVETNNPRSHAKEQWRVLELSLTMMGIGSKVTRVSRFVLPFRVRHRFFDRSSSRHFRGCRHHPFFFSSPKHRVSHSFFIILTVTIHSQKTQIYTRSTTNTPRYRFVSRQVFGLGCGCVVIRIHPRRRQPCKSTTREHPYVYPSHCCKQPSPTLWHIRNSFFLHPKEYHQDDTYHL
jgi:hypothetical protein